VGHRNILEVWQLPPLCLMWCIRREWHARSLEDRGTLVVELKKIVTFHFFYMWIAAHNNLLFSRFHICWTFVLLFLLNRSFSCIFY
jgi:hypothetical protein